ncbi:MAG: hypothetical protein GX567_15295 [Clostridia bacterium]|nr:hypothetical protein [Clostridia bacterium]
MHYIAHRVNQIEALSNLPREYGVEIDLRDQTDGTIYLEHDPFKQGEDFEVYLKNYHHGMLILNVKSERVELKAMEILKKNKIENYFFLDSSFPMIKLLSDQNEKRIALRYSEYEGMDTIEHMAGLVDWVWVDCFTKFPLDRKAYSRMKELGYYLCFVSPELQGQDEKIELYAKNMQTEQMVFDAVCCKEYNIKRWKQFFV